MSRLIRMGFKMALILIVLCSLFIGISSSHAATASSHAAPASKTIKMLVTSYGFNDNSPPSADIAFPKSDGNPTLHDEATEGKGTFNDPITFATDQSELAVGSRVYVPFLQKYFINEDECVECDQDWNNGHKFHIDLWMGPQHASDSTSLFDCEDSITMDSTSVITNPSHNLTVDKTPLFKNNTCTAHIH